MEKFITVPCKVCGGTGKLSRANPDWLRERRKKAGVGLREYARQLGLSPSYISDIELGRRYPTTEVVEAYQKLK